MQKFSLKKSRPKGFAFRGVPCCLATVTQAPTFNGNPWTHGPMTHSPGSDDTVDAPCPLHTAGMQHSKPLAPSQGRPTGNKYLGFCGWKKNT